MIKNFLTMRTFMVMCSLVWVSAVAFAQCPPAAGTTITQPTGTTAAPGMATTAVIGTSAAGAYTYTDNGGAAGAYTNFQNSVQTICPTPLVCNPCTNMTYASPSPLKIKAVFTSFATEVGWDALYVFNGPTTASPPILSANGATFGGFPAGGFWGTAAPGGAAGIKSTDASGCLTFRFRSDSSATPAGWVARITAELAAPGPDGSLLPPDPTPCAMICSPDINVSLSGCNAFTVPAGLVTLVGGCPQITTVTQVTTNGFTGPLAAPPGVFLNNSMCGTVLTPTTLTLTSADVLGVPPANICGFFGNGVSWPITVNGTITFDYVSNGNDVPFTDFFGYSTTNVPGATQSLNQLAATTVELTTGGGVGGVPGGGFQTGTVSVNVTAGTFFTLLTYSTNGLGGPLTATVSNIRFTQTVTTLTCPTPIQLAGPKAGDKLGAGLYNMKFENPFTGAKCTFKITVTAVQPNLTCNDLLNISVNETCAIALVPDMLLENYEALAPCTNASWDIRVWPFGNEAQSTGNVNGIATQYPLGTHTYEIRHPYGQKCWGQFKVEDKLAPRIDCGPIRDIFCYEVDAFVAQTLANATLRPTITDNCGATTAEFTTHKLSNGCDGGSIKRKWLVTDASGNTAFCEQHFRVVRNAPRFCPDNLVLLSCKDATTPDAIALSSGVEAAYPFFINTLGISIPLNESCNWFTTYADIVIGACGTHCHGNKKVIRTWTILDWCNGSVFECTQIIKAVDTEAPTFIVKDTIISTAPWYCEGDFFVPNPWELHDNCDIAPTWTVKSSTVGVTIVPASHPTFKYRAIGVPKGVSQLKYTAVDCCGNEVTIISNVTVVDKTPPVPVAFRDIVIGLVPGYDANGVQDGQAKLFVESVDNGSYDNCSKVRLEIRRPSKTVKIDGKDVEQTPSCGNLGNGNPRVNNNVTFSNKLPANLLNNMPYNANDTDGGLFVKFCCADLADAGADFDGDGTNDVGYHQVIMRVWDDGNMDGIIGNNGDNWNDTWANVKVECKVPPVITCPADATIRCDWPIEKHVSNTAKSVVGVDFSKTGLPEAYGVCTNPVIKFKDSEVLNQCGIGLITRTFEVTEKGITRTCVQRISVNESSSLQPWVTNFPSDWADVEPVSCDGPTADQIKAKGPSNVGGPCDVIGTSTKQWVFDFEDGVCKKWKVEYKYVNWCDNEERGPFYKYFMYRDTEAPVIACADAMYAVDGTCGYNGTLKKSATDGGGCITGGWLKWTVIVDLWADGSADYEYTSYITPDNDVNNMNSGNWGAIRDDNGNGIPDIYVEPTSGGSDVSIKLPRIEGKMSNHKVTWKVSDGCHNFSSCSENFMVVDKKAPTPVCVALSTALMADPDGSGPALPMVELWACDFVDKSYDNCTPSEDLLVTFENVPMQIANIKIENRDVNWDVAHYFNASGGQAAYPARANNAKEKAIEAKYLRGEDGLQLWNPVTGCSAKVWSSTSLTPGASKTDVDVKVTVWDKKLNHDYCWTVLSLINNTSPGAGSRVAGVVSTSAGQSVNNVSVSIDANITEYPKSVSTISSGSFNFADLPNSLNYAVTANKGGDYANGVSTLDLVLIQRHILGIQPLDSPYKMIAADANNDGKVTANDLTDLRKLILGITNTLPNNKSWRFPVASQTLDIASPWNFVETINITPLTSDMDNQNFVAVKIGDVNGNVSTNVSNPAVEGRSSNNIGMVVSEAAVVAGSTVSIPVSARNFNEVFGYQFTMNLNGASLVEVQSGAIEVNASNVGVLSNDVVTMSFASNEGVTVREDETLFTIVVKADKAGNVSEMMNLNSSVTASESYVGNELSVGKVSLEVRTSPVASIELFQNEPNPFKGQTTVSFHMVDAAQAVITVTDVTGKLVNVRKVDAAKGMNSEIFTASELGTSGILFYTLTSGEFTATKKMIIIE